MAIQTLSLALIFGLLLIGCPTLSAASGESDSSTEGGGVSLLSATPSPSPAVDPVSPPAPPPPELDPGTPTPALASSPTPNSDSYQSPPPGVMTGDPSHENHSNEDITGDSESSSGAMSRKQKAGVAIGVIAGVYVVRLAALVFKKRRDNQRRSQKAGVAIGVIAGVCVVGLAALVSEKRRDNQRRSQ